MKTWLKSGLIGAGIFVLLLIIGGLVNILLQTRVTLDFLTFLPCVLLIPGETGMACIVIGPILNLILFFIIGAIVGLIIQKVKG